MNRYISKKNKVLIISLLFFIINLANVEECFAADPSLIVKLKTAFERLQSYILRLATPVAAVSLGVGALMRKFSFGDEEKIRTGKRLIRGSLFSYAFILSIDLVLSAIKTLVGTT